MTKSCEGKAARLTPESAGGPAFEFACIARAVGAPFLRPLQERGNYSFCLRVGPVKREIVRSA
jgi:hypothetical protein